MSHNEGEVKLIIIMNTNWLKLIESARYDGGGGKKLRKLVAVGMFQNLIRYLGNKNSNLQNSLLAFIPQCIYSFIYVVFEASCW